jgi:RNA recognition motif-containing protein
MRESEIMTKNRVSSMGNRNRNGAMRLVSREGSDDKNIGGPLSIRGSTAFKRSKASNGRMERSRVRTDRDVEEEKETKLYISNLDKNVSVGDLRELFGQFGHLKRSTLHHDENGRSQGTAEVEYSSRGQALRAMETYDGVPLDGKAMKIQIVETNITTDNGKVSVFDRLGGKIQNDRNRNSNVPAARSGPPPWIVRGWSSNFRRGEQISRRTYRR